MTAPGVRPIIGRTAPALELINRDGTPWQLADHLGRRVVLIFHRHIH
ncbi:MAG: hypothetical protein AAF531_00535 [Actinomycetota bacterium]